MIKIFKHHAFLFLFICLYQHLVLLTLIVKAQHILFSSRLWLCIPIIMINIWIIFFFLLIHNWYDWQVLLLMWVLAITLCEGWNVPLIAILSFPFLPFLPTIKRRVSWFLLSLLKGFLCHWFILCFQLHCFGIFILLLLILYYFYPLWLSTWLLSILVVDRNFFAWFNFFINL